MKAAELRELNDVELANRLREFREGLLALRFLTPTGQLAKTTDLPQSRGDIPRVEPLLRRRESARPEVRSARGRVYQGARRDAPSVRGHWRHLRRDRQGRRPRRSGEEG